MTERTIRNPIEWTSDKMRLAAEGAKSAISSVRSHDASPPVIRRIGVADVKDALAKGIEDFAACRTDVIFLSIVYPVIGLVLGRLALGQGMFQLMFPLASGFALVGPFLAIGLYEMSRRREQGTTVSWADAFGVLGSPSSGAIAALGVILMAIFVLWLFAAEAIYELAFAGRQPASIGMFVHDVFLTPPGWVVIGVGIGVGFLFALLVLMITVVSFPLLLDRKDVGLDGAIRTSVKAVLANKSTMAVWGLIVAGSLVAGSIPLLLGLAFAFPVLGHAT
ncbi:MAG TPA: DUF2189 domain-containing protein [Alphaproteobacteria bacterium]|nr:DUF2189 domain-containing protein [Alphaproteobacteria bacterium]